MNESEKFLRENQVTEYMKRVEQRLKEESKRVEIYLHKSSLGRLQDACQGVLIEKRLDTFRTEFQSLLDDDKNDDLGRMYSLVSRIPEGLKELKQILELHIYNQGMDAIAKCGEAAINVSNHLS